MKKLLPLFVVIILTIIGLYVFLKNPSSPIKSNDDSYTVVTSFYPLAFALENIIGNTGTVINIGEDRDPHDFHPSTQDVAQLHTADLVVLQGLDFEPWGEDISEQLKKEGVKVIIAGDGITPDMILSSESDLHEGEETNDGHQEEVHEEHDEHKHGEYDPHTWVNPVTYIQTVKYLVEELSKLNPEQKETYRTNGDTLINKLNILAQEYEENLNSCTYREVIVSHNAFGYLAKQYNFTTHSIAGLSTQDQPSSITLSELKDEALSGTIGAILLEENNITAYGEILSKETGLPLFPINPIAFKVKKGEDYLSISRTNLNTLTQALKCS
jgi:zinc transport system substrate-binding protein